MGRTGIGLQVAEKLVRKLGWDKDRSNLSHVVTPIEASNVFFEIFGWCDLDIFKILHLHMKKGKPVLTVYGSDCNEVESVGLSDFRYNVYGWVFSTDWVDKLDIVIELFERRGTVINNMYCVVNPYMKNGMFIHKDSNGEYSVVFY